MKNIQNINKIFNLVILIFALALVFSCQGNSHAEDDDIPQEELTNVIVNVKNLSSGEINSYNYAVGLTALPNIKLENGTKYDVELVFKNGNEDVTNEIKEAKNEHFLLFNFPQSKVNLIRTDTEESTRADGKKVGLKTQWEVIKAVNEPQQTAHLILSLIHDPISVSEALDDTTWGSVNGGETDAEARFQISNQ